MSCLANVNKKYLAAGIVLLYVLLLVPAFFAAQGFLGSTSQAFSPPDSSIITRTQKQLVPRMGGRVFYQPLWIELTQQHGNNMTVDTASFGALCDFVDTFKKTLKENGTKGVSTACGAPAEFRAPFYGGENFSKTIISINKEYVYNEDKFWSFVSDYEKQHTGAAFPFDVAENSFQLITDDLKGGTIDDLFRIDLFSIPLATMVMCYVLGSFRVLVFPLLVIIVTLLFTFAIAYPIALAVTVSAFAPELVSATLVALCIDYCLFVLSRFAEEVEKKKLEKKRAVAERDDYDEEGGDVNNDNNLLVLTDEDKWSVVKTMTVSTTHNVATSGVTIAVSMGGMVLLPVEFVASFGYVFFVGALAAVLVSLTLQPALLLLFFNYFSVTAGDDLRKVRALFCKKQDHGPSETDPAIEKNNNNINIEYETEPLTQREKMLQVENANTKSTWWRIADITYRHPWKVIIVITLLGAPLIAMSSQLETNFSLSQSTPRDSVYTKRLFQMQSDFAASPAPVYVPVALPNSSDDTIKDDHVIAGLQRLISTIHDHLGEERQQLKKIASVVLVPNPTTGDIMNVTAGEVKLLLSPQCPLGQALCEGYQYLWDKLVPTDNKSCMIALNPDADLFGTGGGPYYDRLLDAIDAFNADPANTELGLDVGMTGASTGNWAVMNAVMSFFPYQAIISLSIVLVIIMCVFRSVFVPIRMILTVVFTISAAFGWGALWFNYSWSTHVWTQLEANGYEFTCPIFLFPLLCALTLDYDIFLLTRIIEFKNRGFEDREAIALGVSKSGRVISFAGLIMAISFGGLMFSQVMQLQMFGFTCFFAVVTDTFLIRTFYVPALTSIHPKLSWWPRKFKSGYYQPDADADDVDADVDHES